MAGIGAKRELMFTIVSIWFCPKRTSTTGPKIGRVAWKADVAHRSGDRPHDDLFVNKATPLVSYCSGARYCLDATRRATAIDPASFLAGWSNHVGSATAASRI